MRDIDIEYVVVSTAEFIFMTINNDGIIATAKSESK